MEKSVLKGEACPNLVNAFVNAFDADPWRFPDVATMVVVTKTPQAHVYQLVSAGDVLQMSFPMPQRVSHWALSTPKMVLVD